MTSEVVAFDCRLQWSVILFGAIRDRSEFYFCTDKLDVLGITALKNTTEVTRVKRADQKISVRVLFRTSACFSRPRGVTAFTLNWRMSARARDISIGCLLLGAKVSRHRFRKKYNVVVFQNAVLKLFELFHFRKNISAATCARPLPNQNLST